MAKICYREKNFRAAALDLIEKCNQILDSYAADGYDMTLRQLYYQLVAADEIPNKQTEYDRLGSIVNDGRLAGLIDWDYIVDRTRNLQSVGHWENPAEIIDVYSRYFRVDRWEHQTFRPEVWIEKEALANVFERICNELDVPFFSCRGYTSQSEMWNAGQRFDTYRKNNQTPFIFHFGDHDPSGIDMTRDITDRLSLFCGCGIDVKRLALNMPQIESFNPPPNPAKITDSRAKVYIKQFGYESWELDALPPNVLAGLVREDIMRLVDEDAWNEAERREIEGRESLRKVSENFNQILEQLNPASE